MCGGADLELSQTSSGNGLSVVFLPEWRKRNPYQNLLAEGLGRLGVGVTFGGTQAWFPATTGARGPGQRIVHLHWIQPYLFHRRAIPRLARGLTLLADLRRAKRAGAHIVWTVHNLWSHGVRGVWSAPWERRMRKEIAGLADVLIVHFPEAVESVSQAYGIDASRFEVVPHGHYVDAYPDTVSREEARRQLDIGDKEFVFLFFGMVRGYKGIDRLVETFQRVKGGQVRLMIAGRPRNSALASVLQNEADADGRIKLSLGFVPPEDVQLYMRSADVVVLPATEMLTSGSAILAMSFGKPVVGPDLPHLRYLLSGAGGFLYQQDDPEGLLAALEAARSADLEAMGRANRARVEQWSWERVAAGTVAAYERTIGAGHVSQ